MNWNDPGYTPDAAWITGSAPPAVGFDASAQSSALFNIAATNIISNVGAATATQSTTGAGAAANANNGSFADFSHTLGTDTAPFWLRLYNFDVPIKKIVLNNRTSCCGSRLRDITVQILSASNVVLYTSPLLNPENAGFTFPAGPANLTVELPSAIYGRKVRVSRTVDPDLSGSGGQGTTDE